MAKITNTSLLHDGWQKLYRLSIEEDDGDAYTREVVDLSAAVCVLPFDPQRGMITLVRQLRAPSLFLGESPMLLEAPAGIIEPGSMSEHCARREIMEETGIRLGTLHLLGSFWAAPGSITQKVTLFLAAYSEADKIGAGGGLAEEHERIEVVELSIGEAIRMINTGEIADMKTVCLLQALQAQY